MNRASLNPTSPRLFAALSLSFGLVAGLACTAEQDDSAASGCVADSDCKGDRLCQQGVCVAPGGGSSQDDAEGDAGGDESSDGGVDEGGFVDESGESSDGEGPVSTGDAVVGAWSAAGTVQTEDGPVDVSIGWYLCSDLRMAGFTTLGGYDFLDKGGYSVSESAGEITVTWTSMDTSIGDVWGPDTSTAAYDPDSDTLTFVDGNFGATLYRAEGTVVDSDCDPSW